MGGGVDHQKSKNRFWTSLSDIFCKKIPGCVQNKICVVWNENKPVVSVVVIDVRCETEVTHFICD